MAKAKPLTQKIKWMPDVEAHNYQAAESYLTLLYTHDQVSKMIAGLRRARIVQFKAKDIFRASQLSLLGVSNSHVVKDRMKIRDKISLSPILLVRSKTQGKVVIADGYHRMCAIYQVDEDALIHCKIA